MNELINLNTGALKNASCLSSVFSIVFRISIEGPGVESLNPPVLLNLFDLKLAILLPEYTNLLASLMVKFENGLFPPISPVTVSSPEILNVIAWDPSLESRVDPKVTASILLIAISAETIAGPLFVNGPLFKSPEKVVAPVEVIVTSAISVPVPIEPIATVPVPAVKVMVSDEVPITPAAIFICPMPVSVLITRLDPSPISTVAVPKVILSFEEVKVVVEPPVKSIFSPTFAV